MIHNAHVIAFLTAAYWRAWDDSRWMAVAFYSQWHIDELRAAGANC